MTEFKNRAGDNIIDGIELDVEMLTTGHWPY